MTKAQIQRIVASALTAPSGDNCQPWTFLWNQSELAIGHQGDRARHMLNRKNHASLLSLGCVLELIRIAASHEKAGAVVDLGDFDDSHGYPWATVRFRESARAPDALAPFIGTRVTDRRIYHGGSLALPVLQKLHEAASRTGHAGMHVIDTYPADLVDYLLKCEEFVWDHPLAMTDFLAWLRMDKREVESTRDGLPWRNLGVNFAESRMLGLLRSRPGMVGLFKMTGFKHLLRSVARRQLRSNAGVICFSVSGTDPSLLVEAGSLALRAWLILAQHGFGVQPLTIPSLSVFDLEMHALPSSTRPEYVDLFANGGEIMRSAFSLPVDARPVWAMRTGISPDFPAGHRTLRRPLSECLRIVTSHA